MKRFLSLILCIVLSLSLFAACGDDSESNGIAGQNTGTTSSTETLVPTPTPIPSDDEMIAKLGLQNVGRELTNTPLDTMVNETDAKTIYVKDFGAVGDGITNDYNAVKRALRALKQLPKGSSLEFNKNTTYYLGKRKGDVLTIAGYEHCLIKGDNTTILVDAPASYLSVTNSKNVVLEGFNFNYKIKPYAFSVKVENINTIEKTAEITLDRTLGITETYTAGSVEFFGVANREDGRYHMSISTIEIIDAEAFKYKFTFNGTFSNIEERLEMIVNDGIIVPVPNIGHAVAQAITITNNTDLMFKDCNLWSSCMFTSLISRNDGKVIFENFNITPDPAENGGNIRIVGWRDGFHCKENRAQLIWKNCQLKWVYDDVFNISCSMLKIKSISGDNIALEWPETRGTFGYMKPGDTVTFYDTITGKLLGSSTIKTYENDVLTLSKAVDGLRKGVYVANNSLAAPNSQIINCKIKGTLRFRTPMYIVDSDIHVTAMWLAFEWTGRGYLEGPVAENILFSNCNITFDDDKQTYVTVSSNNARALRAIKAGTMTKEEAYYVNNIVFRNCKVNPDCIKFEDVETICDDVIIYDNCTK